MPTLYLSAPFDKTQEGQTAFYKDFYRIVQNGIGPDYAIYSTLIGQIRPGLKVVLFDRVRQKQAEGKVTQVIPKPSNRVPRYDIYIQDLTTVPYSSPPRVNRCGVEVYGR